MTMTVKMIGIPTPYNDAKNSASGHSRLWMPVQHSISGSKYMYDFPFSFVSQAKISKAVFVQ